MNDKLTTFAIEEEVKKRLEFKSSKHDYGSLFKEIAGLKHSMAPLIDKSPFLYRFVEQVNKMEILELNAKEFNQRVEQLNYKLRDLSSSHEIEVESLAQRLTVMENTLMAMQAEQTDLKVVVERVKNQGTSLALIRPDYMEHDDRAIRPGIKNRDRAPP